MSKHHNYSQYSKNNKNEINEEAVNEIEETSAVVENTIDTTVESTVEPEITATPEPTVESDVPPIPVVGTVINCAKLNVRAKPLADAAVLCVLDANSEIEVRVEKSTNEWVNVITAAGIEGFCMRRFMKVDL